VEEAPAGAIPALRCRVERNEDTITHEVQPGFTYGASSRPEPWFVIRDAGSSVLGHFEGTDLPALAIRNHTNWKSVLSLAPGLPPELLRGIARAAGIHVYSEGNDPIYIGKGLVGIHAAKTGEKVVSLPHPAAVTEMFSGESLGHRSAEIRRQMRAGETLLFRLDYQ
jgi:hypothetical protein